jgi:hypothetical protein
MASSIVRRTRIGNVSWTLSWSLIAALSSSCSNDSTPSSAQENPAAIHDVIVFDDAELNGGEFAVTFTPPYGGGRMLAGRNYFYETSSGGLLLSPLGNGTQTQTPSVQPLDAALPLPVFTPTRILKAGQFLLMPLATRRQLTYTSAGIRQDDLGGAGLSPLISELWFDYEEVPLSGVMGSSPEELQAQYPIAKWIHDNNFAANAKWRPGAAYIKRKGQLLADVLYTYDCPTLTN